MKLLLLATFLFIALHTCGQNGSNTVEVQSYFRNDRYPDFIYAINSTTTNTVKIQGESFGVLGLCGRGITGNMKVKIGLGYYRYSFNKIKSFNSSFGEGNSRAIIYPDADMIYSTSKYWYHSLYLSGGLEKYFLVTPKIDLLIAGYLQYYRTYSQYYKIFDTNSYKVNNGKNMGFGGTIQAGFAYKISRFIVAPQFILPVYDRWRQDKVFPGEKNSATRNKWINGYGASLGLQYELLRKR